MPVEVATDRRRETAHEGGDVLGGVDLPDRDRRSRVATRHLDEQKSAAGAVLAREHPADRPQRLEPAPDQLERAGPLREPQTEHGHSPGAQLVRQRSTAGFK